MSISIERLVTLITALNLLVGSVQAQEPQADKPVKQLILPGDSFLVAERPAFILWPDESLRKHPQPWILYAPTLPGLPDQHEKWMHEQFLDAGIAVAGIDIGESYGSPKGQALFTALHSELVKHRGFATRTCLLGRSRGGLWISNWAISNPEKVAGIAGIYPVFDLRSYPGVERAAPAYDMTADHFADELDHWNPVSRLDILANASIPVFLIHGDVDRVVPIDANSQALIRAYKEAGAAELATLKVATGQGHNFWPGFFRCQELIDFAIRTSRWGAESKSAKSVE